MTSLGLESTNKPVFSALLKQTNIHRFFHKTHLWLIIFYSSSNKRSKMAPQASHVRLVENPGWPNNLLSCPNAVLHASS